MKQNGRTRRNGNGRASRERVRFAVVGLGYIAQSTVLPAFSHAKDNCELAALISGDPKKQKELGKKYRVEHLSSYDEYEQCLKDAGIDAVYIALPNSMHHEYTVRAARTGVHVLCEKPMALSVRECEEMIAACKENNVKLMIAYRLHFESANLTAIERIANGQVGEPRIFNSVFTMQVRDENIRTEEELGGGALWDIGIYCINAARYLFRAEPRSVCAVVLNPNDRRFEETDGLTGGILDFGKGRLATFITSFGAADASNYQLLGTKGIIKLDPAYEIHEKLKIELSVDGKTKLKRTFPLGDQFAPLLIRFAEAIQQNHSIEPSGVEGLADVRIIRALYHSAATGKRIELNKFEKKQRPTRAQQFKIPAPKKSDLYRAETPTKH